MNKPIDGKDDIVVQKVEDKTLVYDLNETSAAVSELCDGKRTASDVSNENIGEIT